ncbi:MAG: aryl-sulfate sulfotransferase [Kofleriaceae bacterium]
MLTLAAALGCGGASGEPTVDAPSVVDAAVDATSPDAAAAATDYLLFAPIGSTTTYLMDRAGQLVHSWPSSRRPGQSVQLLDDGHLLRTEALPSSTFTAGGIGGAVTTYAWDGAVVWTYSYATAAHHAHHDAVWLPDGHAVMLAWETVPAAQALGFGRDAALLPTTGDVWADHLIEIDPATDQIVWEWHVIDHLVQDRDPTKPGYGALADHPERIDANLVARRVNDWTHANAVAYDAALDQLIVSAHNANEVWIIDHGTTTAEAAGRTGGRRGRGGDLLYRWGNPASYGAGTAADQIFYGQHNAQWIGAGLDGAGDLLVFNNGSQQARPYSTIDQLTPPLAADGTYGSGAGGWGPTSLTWQHQADPPTSLYAANISGAQRLPNGNTLVCVGPAGRFLEVTPGHADVWSYTYPGASGVFRVTSYPADHPALRGRALPPLGPVPST